MHDRISTYVPGAFVLAPGSPSDYYELERFHYQPTRPRTWCAVWVARWSRDHGPSTTVAVGVLSWPVPVILEREGFFGLRGMSYRERILFANANIRTISRVVVHPQFRSIGLASLLVRKLCQVCPTRYVEALAIMGRVHPFFEKAGMRRMAAMENGEWKRIKVQNAGTRSAGLATLVASGERVDDEPDETPLRPWYYLYDRGEIMDASTTVPRSGHRSGDARRS